MYILSDLAAWRVSLMSRQQPHQRNHNLSSSAAIWRQCRSSQLSHRAGSWLYRRSFRSQWSPCLLLSGCSWTREWCDSCLCSLASSKCGCELGVGPAQKDYLLAIFWLLGGTAVQWLASQEGSWVWLSVSPGPFCVGFVCSPCVCVGPLWALLLLLPTIQMLFCVYVWFFCL